MAFVAMIIAACGGGGGNGPTAPPSPPPAPPPSPTGSLSGSVFDLENDRAIVGATITAGSLSTTSGPDGRFLLPGIGVATVSVSFAAAGFDQTSESISIKEGTNLFSEWLPRVNTMYDNDTYLIYIPSGVSTIRGVFFPVLGAGVDSRNMVREQLGYFSAFPLSGDVGAYRQRTVAFARANGFAIMGGRIFQSNPDVIAAILDVMTKTSAQSNRPELALAPMLFHGHSTGACVAYDFAVAHPERVIGFISAKGLCPTVDAAPALKVPGYLIYSAGDNVDPTAAPTMISTFQQYRGRGAIWGLAQEPGATHMAIADQNLIFDWLQEVVTQRLPATPTPGSPVELRALSPSSGWLGNRTSQAIAAEPCYSGDKLSASWLPSERTARDWQAFVSSSTATTVNSCSP
jgi:predicted esterase